MMQEMTRLQAFNAMFKLFEIYYKEKGSGTVRGSLSHSTLDPHSGNISIMLGMMNFDESLWEIWIESIDKTIDKKDLKNHDLLTPLQSFKAIPLYLEGFYGTDLFEDIISFVFDLRFVVKNTSLDSILWKQWMQCVNEVLSVDDSCYYPKL